MSSSSKLFQEARNGGDIGFQSSMIRHENTLAKQSKSVDDDMFLGSEDGKESNAQDSSRNEEILSLRKQIANAYVRELQLLNEKSLLEKRVAELRLAIDERQSEAVTSALNEMARRKVDLEENAKLTDELKVVEGERYLFVSSLLGLLAEYGASPIVTNASAISNSLMRLHDDLLWKIRVSNDKIRNMATALDSQRRNEIYDEEKDGSRISDNQETLIRTNLPNYKVNETSSVLAGSSLPQRSFGTPRVELAQTPDRQGLEIEKDFYSSSENPNIASTSNEEGPGIEDFQIIGTPIPGEKIRGCGFPVRGTALCMFQWVRHLDDGTRQYIEGATNPEYVVTADDVDKLIAVECIPMDEYGRQGELVKLFANNQNKIKCDDGMREEINNYISEGEVVFDILLLVDASEVWEPSSLHIDRTGYHIKNKSHDSFLIKEKFSDELKMKIPYGLSTQVVLVCSDGSSHPLNASNVRMRDVLVLTMRYFQIKALSEKKKGILFRA